VRRKVTRQGVQDFPTQVSLVDGVSIRESHLDRKLDRITFTDSACMLTNMTWYIE